jgi:hypothetical protein
MEKRYQVFISSTFTDLREERQAVLKAVLEVGHMPAGMELFPASDASAWELIKGVIDESDYYLLIIGGRYGSLDSEGVGYTEREYDYATQKAKPVIAFLHEAPGEIPRDKTETGDGWEKMLRFREKIEKTHARNSWRSTDELKARVIVSLVNETRRHPAIGWVRADQVPTGTTLADVIALRNRIGELELAAEAAAVSPAPGTEDLEQGDDTFVIHAELMATSAKTNTTKKFTSAVPLTWNEIFAAVAPKMINEATNYLLKHAIKEFFQQRTQEAIASDRQVRDVSLLIVKDDEVETCVVQFRALGLIRESTRQRSLRDTQTYWQLTPYGDHLMTKLRARKRLNLKADLVGTSEVQAE